MRRFLFCTLLSLFPVAMLALVLAGSSRSLVRAPASAFVCDTTYVSQTDDGFTVSPFSYADWALGPLPPQPFEWHILPELNDWILDGGPKPAKITYDVVNPDGTPNFPEAPEWFPNALEDTYWFVDGDGVEHDVTHASQVFASADVLPIAEPDLIAQLTFTPEDQAIFDEFPDRYVRFEEAMDELRVIATGNFSHDAENLQCAIDAAPPGGTVELGPGTFHVSRSIIGEGFSGVLKGQGTESTTIETVPGGFNDAPPPFEDRSEILIFEEADDIRIADMTLEVKGTRDGGEHGILRDSFGGIYITGEHNGVPDRAISEGSASIERVDFVGESGSEFLTGTNLSSAVTIAGEAIGERDRFGTSWVEYFKPFAGGFEIRNSRFENVAYGLQTFWLTDSSLEVGGEASEGNSFGPCSASAISLIDLSNTEVVVAENETQDCPGVSVVQGLEGVLGHDLGPTGFIPVPAEIEVEGNILDAGPATITAPEVEVEIWDVAGASGAPTVEAVIEDNELVSEGHVPPWGPIFTFGVSDVKVRDNSFSGSGDFAIYIGPSGTPDSDVKLQNNDFEDFSPGPAHIWLGPGTSDNLVEEDEPSTVTEQVLDEGTDNTIIGAERVAGPGPDVTDEVEERLATLGDSR